MNLFPLLAVIIPIFLSIMVYVTSRKGFGLLTKMVILMGTFLPFLFVLASFPKNGDAVELHLPGFMDFGLYFKVDYLSFIFGFLISLIWVIATVYSFIYMEHEHGRIRFYTFWLLSLGGTLGVVFTGDLFSLFLFFELMTFSSFVMVIHEEDYQAMSAGNLYIFLGVIGGLALLTAILLMNHWTGTTQIQPVLELIMESGNSYWLLAMLFLVGFGIKAGIVPMHVWLPKAHPVAPTPASALLSGLMIKTGVYGLMRVFNIILTPSTWEGMKWYYYTTNGNAGFILILIGLVTMFLGAFMATQNSNVKGILAYSSVSQVGYMAMGIGAAAYLGSHGAVAASGAIYHVINHGIFKAGLFLVIGAVYLCTHKLDIEELGGLGKVVPFLMIVFIFGALGIIGMPGFNGYISKTLLHHGIVEAYEYHHNLLLYYGEKVFKIASGLTVCYFIKLFKGIFMGKTPENFKDFPATDIVLKFSLVFFPVLIMFIGLFPSFLLENLILPSMSLFPYESYFVESNLSHINFWHLYDLKSSITKIGLGIIFFIGFSRFNLFKINFPSFLSIEYIIYLPAAKIAMFLCKQCTVNIDGKVSLLYRITGKGLLNFCAKVGQFENSQPFYNLGKASINLIESVGHLEQKTNLPLLDSWGQSPQSKVHISIFDKVPSANLKNGKPVPIKWNFSNLNFNGLLIATMLVLVIIVLLFGFTAF